MKQRVILIAAICAIAAFAQSPVEEPSSLNVFYRLETGKLVPLEQQTTKGSELKHGFMSTKAAAVTQISGPQSPVRFPAGAMEFVVATATDPAVYSLRKLEVKKTKSSGTRELLIVTAQASMFGKAKVDSSGTAVALDFTRYGSASYKAAPRQPLVPGEYAFWRPDLPAVFCFGVD